MTTYATSRLPDRLYRALVPGVVLHPRPVEVYRVEPVEGRTGSGLWYDAAARFTGLIHTLPNARSAALPMGWDPTFHEGGSWVSATDTPADLLQWFSLEDLRLLEARRYLIRVHRVDVVRHMNGHQAFRWEDVYSSRDLTVDELIELAAKDSSAVAVEALQEAVTRAGYSLAHRVLDVADAVIRRLTPGARS